MGLYLVIAGIALPVLEEILPTALHAFLPSGVALGMGIYVTPNWIFPRFVGAAAGRTLAPTANAEFPQPPPFAMQAHSGSWSGASAPQGTTIRTC